MLQGREFASISNSKMVRQVSKPKHLPKKSIPTCQNSFGILLVSSMLIGLGVMFALLLLPMDSESIVQKIIETTDFKGKNGEDEVRTGSFIIHGHVYNESGKETVVSEVWITNMRTGDSLKVMTDTNGYYNVDVGSIFGKMKGLRNDDILKVNTTLGIFVAENYTTCKPLVSERIVNLTLSLPSQIPEFKSFAIPLASLPILYFIFAIKLRKNKIKEKLEKLNQRN